MAEKLGNLLRDQGMQLALFGAENRIPDWQNKAIHYLKLYISAYPSSKFQAEDVRLWAYKKGLERPPNDRAWGSVIARAKKMQLIIFDGYENVDNPTAHSTPAAVWKGVQ